MWLKMAFQCVYAPEQINDLEFMEAIISVYGDSFCMTYDGHPEIS
jgi:hypothetical protein